MVPIISAMARNSSATSRCTSARVCARQTCPDRPREHGERRVLRRFEHDGAASRQGRGDLLRGQQDRRVPRDHRAHDTDGLAQRHHHVVAALERCQRLTGQLVHPPGVMIEDIGHERR
jgi:hypothetical protein